MSVSIVLINYNTKQLAENTIRSIIEHTQNINYEIIVVDNSSDKNQQVIFPNPFVRILRDIENKGFGNACNIGAKQAKFEILLFINSDILLTDNTILSCFEILINTQNAGIVGPRIVLRDGQLDHGCKRGFPTPLSALTYMLKLDRLFPRSKTFGHYRQTYVSQQKIGEVDAVSGSFLMIWKHLFDDLNGFDETFFMYGEDLDLCYRVKQRGYQVLFNPLSTVVHLKGQSGLHIQSKQTLFHFYNAMTIFYEKHYENKYSSFTTHLVKLAIKGQYQLALLTRSRT